MARPWLFYLVIGVAALFTIGTAGGLIYSAQPTFCAQCHEMGPEFNTWESSSHAKVPCMSCHEGARPWNLPHKVSSMIQVYLHVTGKVPDQIKIHGKIENHVCQDCHTATREVTPSGDLTIPHAKHSKIEGMLCQDCHAGVAHAGINTRFPDLHPASMELSEIASRMKPRDFRPAMTSCINCHDEREATLSCESCHKGIKTPATHQSQEWRFSHGPEAMQAVSECLFCHDIVNGKHATREPRPILAVRENNVCLDCHLQRPPNHTDAWALGHREPAAADKQPCLVCHDQVRTPGSKAEKVVACAECHNSNHPKPFIQEHVTVVKQGGMSQCFRCHDARSCSNCHTQRGIIRG